jgi:hypothetical protein
MFSKVETRCWKQQGETRNVGFIRHRTAKSPFLPRERGVPGGVTMPARRIQDMPRASWMYPRNAGFIRQRVAMSPSLPRERGVPFLRYFILGGASKMHTTCPAVESRVDNHARGRELVREPMREFSFQLAAILLLGAFLLRRHQARQMAAERAEIEARLTGHGFETPEAIKTRLKSVRQQHEVIGRRRRMTAAHQEFSASVRRSLLRLGYFRELQDHPEHASRRQH